MLRIIGAHPFIFGSVTSVVFIVTIWSQVFGEIGTNRIRGLGLIVFGAAAALLFFAMRDRESIFWFFLGGAISATLLFLASLALMR